MLTSLLCSIALLGWSPQPPPEFSEPEPEPGPVTLVIQNAKIWTGDADRPAATALAVRDGRFAAVGNDDDVAALIAPETRVIDAEGQRVLPGLIDTHIHLAGAADDFRHLYLREATSREHLLEMLRTYAVQHDEDDWVVGVRWTAESWPDQRPPTADEIEQATGGRKTVLVRMDGHMLLASSSALTYANISKDGPDDPPGGRIGRTADGTPDGAIYEQAMGLVRRHIPDTGGEDAEARFRRAIAELNRLGVTQVGAIEPTNAITEVLVPLDEAGELTLRLAVTIRSATDRVSHWRTVFEWIVEHLHPSPNIRIIGFKGFMDGTLGSRTAWMTEPFNDNPTDPDNAGFPLALAGSGELGNLIQLAARIGLQPAVHAIGDRANHVVLNWYADIATHRRRSFRPRVEHAQHLRPDDVSRFAELGVVASMQPLHKADDGRYAEQRLGMERLRTSYAYRDLIDSGAILAFGSDWPVVSPNPFLGIHAAVSAKTLDDKTFLPEQAITVEEALIAYTRHAATCLLSERETGMIRPDFAADFIIIDRDILAIDIDDVPDTNVLLTVMGGRVVHDALARTDSEDDE